MAQESTSVKVAVITGVSKGIGLAQVKEFIDNGYTVFGCARSQAKIAELNTQYPNKEGKNISYFSVVDVTNGDAVKSWAKEIFDNYGSPKIVVANAGYSQKLEAIDTTTIDTFELSMSVNVKHPFLLSQAFLPYLRQSKQNCGIFGISSGAGRQAMGLYATYCASKWALEGFFAAMAKELESSGNVMCATYDPGMAGTEMFATTNSIDDISSVGMPTPEDCAKIIVNDLILKVENPKENNGKQLTSSMFTDEKFKDAVQAGVQRFMQTAMTVMQNLGGQQPTEEQKADQ